MPIQYIAILLSFSLSFVGGFIFIPAILHFCQSHQLFDFPTNRKVHRQAIPRLGGIAFVPCMVISAFVALFFLNKQTNNVSLQVTLRSFVFLVSLAMVYFMGVLDDIIGLKARNKFIIQMIAAALISAIGLRINSLYGFLGIYDIPIWCSIPLSVFFILFVIDSINLIDGIDGLCATITFLILLSFLYSHIVEASLVYAILIAGLMGVLLPYLYFNMLGGHKIKRKIFMGDSGSLSLGFIISVLFIIQAEGSPMSMAFEKGLFILPYSLMIVPVFDVVRVILVRLRHRKPIFLADKNHIHHKIMRAGFNQHQVLGLIIGMSSLFCGMNFVLFNDFQYSVVTLVCVDIFLYMGIHFLINLHIRRHGEYVFV